MMMQTRIFGRFLLILFVFSRSSWADQVTAPAVVAGGQGHIAMNFSPPLSDKDVIEITSKNEPVGRIRVSGGIGVYKMLVPVNLERKRFSFRVLRNGESIGSGKITSRQSHRRRPGLGVLVGHQVLEMNTVTTVTIKSANIKSVHLDFDNGSLVLEPDYHWSEAPTFMIQSNAKRVVEASRFDRQFNHVEIKVENTRAELAQSQPESPKSLPKVPPPSAEKKPAQANPRVPEDKRVLPPPPVPCTFTNSCQF